MDLSEFLTEEPASGSARGGWWPGYWYWYWYWRNQQPKPPPVEEAPACDTS